MEIPLDDIGVAPSDSIESISLVGTLSGTFYLDDIRLVTATPVQPATAVLETQDATTPESFALSQNYPNPFNPETTIRFDLPSSTDAELSLFNLSGQRVATLISGFREAGSYTLGWDGRDDAGRDLASGMYFYRLIAGDQIETRKLMLLR